MSVYKISNILAYHCLFGFGENNNGEKLEKQSPEYISSKWNRFIGFAPEIKNISEDYIDKGFLELYAGFWGKEKMNKIKPMLIYLDSVKNQTNINYIIKNFENIIGPISKITSKNNMNLLHPTLKDFHERLYENNKKEISRLIRNLKVEEILNEKF